DQIHPQHLHRLQWKVGDGAGADEGDRNRDDVDRELELQEFGDGVIDVAAPHHGLDDGGEVVVGEDDVRSLLGDVGSSD
ncbi:hypothetical protein PMAYCL1PPCAC_04580, partial [Pristionchus mayeri]